LKQLHLKNQEPNSSTARFEVSPPPEKIAGGFQQAGKKEGGLGEGIFARLLSAPKARWAGSAPVRAQIVARKRSELRSVIATKNYGDSFSIKYRGKTRKSIIAIVGEWTSFIRERKEEVVEVPIQSQ
jgi:hypothetical protein